MRLELFGFGVVDAEGLGGDFLHLLLGLGAVVVVGGGVGDDVDHVHALDDLAEGGVLAVEVGGLVVHDEELAARRIGHHGACHGEDAAIMLEVVLAEAVVLELALDPVARAAHAGALGVAALDHEAGDDPVEDEPVVEALVH